MRDMNKSFVMGRSHGASLQDDNRQNHQSSTSENSKDGKSEQKTPLQQNRMIGTMNFDRFCSIVRFPNSMSPLVRQRCYLLASQCRMSVPFTSHTSKILPPDVSTSVNNCQVLSPCPQDICRCIMTLTMTGRPFDMLHLFGERCFQNMSRRDYTSITVTDTLRLYICAYQKRDIWKECWKGIIPVFSTLIANDVESFTSSNEFDHDSFIDILKNSRPY